MKILLLFISLFIITKCEKELSCEGCIGTIDTTPVITDTVYNDLITTCDIFIPDNSKVRAIYPQVKTKLNPGHHTIFDTIKMDSTQSSTYKRTYNLKDYFDMNLFFKGDTFKVQYGIRYWYGDEEMVQKQTLIY